MDRTTKECLETFPIESSTNGTFQRVPLETQPDQRVYVYSSSSASTATATTSPTAVVHHRMYWMQSQSDEGEDEAVAKVNQYLVSPQDAAPESPQVDALSNILEHLGMPQQQSSSTTTPFGGVSASGTSTNTTNNTNATGASLGGTLTLADLQGAMAGLGAVAAAAPTTTEPIPLHQVVTPAAIQSLDDAAKARLLELLPEEQRTLEHLHDNLMSPQIQQTLRALSQAILPDEQGQLDGYHSVIANFQLDPRDGEAALTSGNPIQAFLDCILASVEKEEPKEQEEEEEEQQHQEEEEDGMQE